MSAIAEVVGLVGRERSGPSVVPEAALEGMCGLLSAAVEQQVGRRGEEGGVPGEDSLVGDVLGEHGDAHSDEVDHPFRSPCPADS